jgi:hypothetical protein
MGQKIPIRSNEPQKETVKHPVANPIHNTQQKQLIAEQVTKTMHPQVNSAQKDAKAKPMKATSVKVEEPM